MPRCRPWREAPGVHVSRNNPADEVTYRKRQRERRGVATVVRLLDRLPLLYQILDLTAEISLRLGQRVLRICLIRVEKRIARQKQRPPIVNARHHFEHGSDAFLHQHRTIIGRREPNLPIDCIIE